MSDLTESLWLHARYLEDRGMLEGVRQDLTDAADRIEALEAALQPIAELDLTGVHRGGIGIVFQRNSTFIHVEDVLRARQVLGLQENRDD